MLDVSILVLEKGILWNMANKNIRWLHSQLASLVDKGVIDDATSKRLQGHYDMDHVVADRSLSVMTIILSAIGGLLVGGGVILIFAHNWDQIDRPMRAVLAFTPLLISQVLTVMALFPRHRSQAWNETAAVLMFCAVPACIALIGQTYHISSDTEAFLTWWFVLLLPIIYLLKAHLTALLLIVLATVLGCFYRSPYWLCLLALMPYWWLVSFRDQQSIRQSQFAWLYCLSLAIVLPAIVLHFTLFFGNNEFMVMMMLMLLSGALAMYLYGGNFEPKLGFWKRPFTNVGAVGTSVCGLILTFSDPWEKLLGDEFSMSDTFLTVWHAGILGWLLITLFMGLLLVTIRRAIYRLLPFSVLWLLVLLSFILPDKDIIAISLAVTVNILMVAAGIWYALLGLKQHSTSQLNFGLLLVMSILMMRFFDQDLSFIGRGIAFIVMGSIFIAINVWYSRRRVS